MGEREINVDELLKQIINAIRDFIQADWNVVGELSTETGISPEEIFKIIYSEYVSIENVIQLYNTIQLRIEAKNREILTKMDSEETEKLLNFQLKELKAYVQGNSNDVSELSRETGVQSDEILRIAYTEGKAPAIVIKLYSAAQRLIKAKTQEILNRHAFSQEAEALVSLQYEEIKEYIKPNPNVVGDLSRESGIPSDEIFKIVYTDTMVPMAKIGYLHDAVKRLKTSKSQEIIDRNMGM